MKDQIIATFSKELKSILDSLIIKDNKVFVTLKAANAEEAKILEKYRIECKKKVSDYKAFNEINVVFSTSAKKFSKVIAVSSCKGGVGKSTVAVNLALSIKKLNYKVGLLDADIYGPSLPKLLNLKDKPTVNEKKKIVPLNYNGLEAMSIGLLIDKNKPLIWRGPMLQSAILQLINEVEWNNLDYLIIDMPPGTGDTHLTIIQKIKIDHVLIVTTPQEVALSDIRKGINMFTKFKIPISGIIENMSYFICEKCDSKHYLFGKDGGEALSKEFNVKFLGKIPFEKIISDSGEAGKPEIIQKNKYLDKTYKSIALDLLGN